MPQVSVFMIWLKLLSLKFAFKLRPLDLSNCNNRAKRFIEQESLIG